MLLGSCCVREIGPLRKQLEESLSSLKAVRWQVETGEEGGLRNCLDPEKQSNACRTLVEKKWVWAVLAQVHSILHLPRTVFQRPSTAS